LDIEVTSYCNLKCRFCPAWTEGANIRHMDPLLYASIIDRVDFPTTIVPWLNGEPLLHPEYYDLIKYTTDKGLPCYITTNGTLWNERLFNHITNRTSCYQLIFSLDGLPLLKSQSIEKARPGSNRELILSNIKRFLRLKRSKGNEIDVCLKICRRGQDYGEIEEDIAYWLKTPGVDFVCVGDDLVDDNTAGMRVYPCQYSDNNFLVIKSDGYATLCAYNDRMTNDRQYAIGHVGYEDNLLDFYNNDAYTRFRKDQRKGIFHGPCKTCGFAYTGTGFNGELRFRDKSLTDQPIYYHQDYYNQFFSLKRKWKIDDYYQMGYIGRGIDDR
jgi:MoaA/NifB/PqqE/SkfB family radical SAM enzyme